MQNIGIDDLRAEHSSQVNLFISLKQFDENMTPLLKIWKILFTCCKCVLLLRWKQTRTFCLVTELNRFYRAKWCSVVDPTTWPSHSICENVKLNSIFTISQPNGYAINIIAEKCWVIAHGPISYVHANWSAHSITLISIGSIE